MILVVEALIEGFQQIVEVGSGHAGQSAGFSHVAPGAVDEFRQVLLFRLVLIMLERGKGVVIELRWW